MFKGKINIDWDSMDLPLQWKRPRTIFVNSMSDLFHEDVPVRVVERVFRTMKAAPQHAFQVLTKRPERALSLASRLPWPGNVWLGVSVESESYTDRIASLVQVPAAIRFLSCEPLLGPLSALPLDGVHWVIVGGESGPGARPMHEKWVLDIKSQCHRADVAFFFKQWGGVRKCVTGRDLQGRTWDEMPHVEKVLTEV